MRSIHWLPLLLLAALAAGCSSARKDYESVPLEPELEVPPNLSSSRIRDAMVVPPTSYSEYQSREGAPRAEAQAAPSAPVLPAPAGIGFHRDRCAAWLEVEATPDALWPRLVAFWKQNGFEVAVEKPELGIIETDWKKNFQEQPRNPYWESVRKVLALGATTRTLDRFRLRLEPGSDGKTLVFIAQRGLRKAMEVSAADDASDYWADHSGDIDLEAEMLRRLMVYLGADEKTAEAQVEQARNSPPPARAERVEEGGRVWLRLPDVPEAAWRRLGLAIDRIGFAVADRDIGQHIYYVDYRDPEKEKKGGLSSLAFWRDDEERKAERFQIRIRAEGEGSRLEVLDASGAPATGETGRRLLQMLYEQLR